MGVFSRRAAEAEPRRGLARTSARIASSSAIFTEGGGRGELGRDEVQLAAIDVDVGDPDLDPVPQPVAPARSAADQGVRPRFQVIIVVAPGW